MGAKWLVLALAAFFVFSAAAQSQDIKITHYNMTFSGRTIYDGDISDKNQVPVEMTFIVNGKEIYTKEFAKVEANVWKISRSSGGYPEISYAGLESICARLALSRDYLIVEECAPVNRAAVQDNGQYWDSRVYEPIDEYWKKEREKITSKIATYPLSDDTEIALKNYLDRLPESLIDRNVINAYASFIEVASLQNRPLKPSYFLLGKGANTPGIMKIEQVSSTNPRFAHILLNSYLEIKLTADDIKNIPGIENHYVSALLWLLNASGSENYALNLRKITSEIKDRNSEALKNIFIERLFNSKEFTKVESKADHQQIRLAANDLSYFARCGERSVEPSQDTLALIRLIFNRTGVEIPKSTSLIDLAKCTPLIGDTDE